MTERRAEARRGALLAAATPMLAAALILCGARAALAQPPRPAPLGDPTGRAGEQPPLLQEEPRPPAPPPSILPPIPAEPPRELERLPAERIFVREIRVEGNTVFSPGELAAIVAPYVGREVTAEDLESLRVALTRLYVERGYINSGALLPDQAVVGGVIVYRIIEGSLVDVDVQGNRWFRAGYLEGRLRRGAEPPLNVNRLQERLQLLLDDPRIRRLNADLRPGLRAGEATLVVRVDERFPYRLWLDLNNHQSPSVGAERGILSAEHQNLTGNGDVLTLRYGTQETLDPLLDFRYAVPLTVWDTTASVQYRRNTFAVVERPFRTLDIDSESEIYTLGIRQPVYRTPNLEAAVELLGERLSHETALLGERFNLAPGARNGKSVVTALRAVQEVVHRTQDQVIAGRSRFSVGIDALGATIHPGAEADSEFFAWLGQFQWVRRLPLLATQVVFRSDLQLANDPLMSLEQAAVGGRYSVRGYRENTFVSDNAFLTSLEVRVPIVQNTRWADYLQLAPFFDYGRAWNAEPTAFDAIDISSVGIGLRWALTIGTAVPLRTYMEVYWGYPLRKIRTPDDDDLQDKGLHLQFVVGWF